ncbi:GAF and ANTAR domain-containing protein [Nakamurella leprariae]|uniref:GAF and ANTAR domain-containing protein n=1 Tax=Nakamurella leprariae TaxID=2803911 RepID=A0A938Y8Q0_9ACTN|nr:GAF and ANTAR domain-containing protein [Nakamurella leprariae]MBM9467895.1 GAF and ANTAR domain-containing protein [Nakamurella leprariae]
MVDQFAAREGRSRTSEGKVVEDGPALRFSEYARSLQAEDGVAPTLAAIVQAAAVDGIPNAEHAGIAVLSRREIRTVASSDDLVGQVDRIQAETGQGPFWSGLRDHVTVRIDDLQGDRRWPAFTTRAAELEVRSMLSLQLFVRDRELGALSLYSSVPDAFDHAAEQVGLLMASHAAIAMVGAQQQHHLEVALANRDLIGQAKGVLMERYRITADRAFALLVRASQDGNLKMAEVARRVTETGALPDRG